MNMLLQVNYIVINRRPDLEDSKVCEAADHTKSIVRHGRLVDANFLSTKCGGRSCNFK